MGDLTTYVHIKDAHLADESVCPAGEGDGQVRELLRKLVERNYQGVLSLEPHLAGGSSSLSGEEAMTIAVNALRALMAEEGIAES